MVFDCDTCTGVDPGKRLLKMGLPKLVGLQGTIEQESPYTGGKVGTVTQADGVQTVFTGCATVAQTLETHLCATATDGTATTGVGGHKDI
jgi:hypothetical protein